MAKKTRKPRRSAEEEEQEEVLAAPLDSDTQDMYRRLGEASDDDQEGDEQEHDLGEARTAWGRAGNFYDEGKDDELEEEEEEDRQAAIDEAIEIERTQMEAMSRNDFGDDDLEIAEDQSDTIGQKEKQLTENLQQELDSLAAGLSLTSLATEDGVGAELPSLLSDFKGQLAELKSRVLPLISKARRGEIPTQKGVSYVDVKYQLLLSYCINLSYYIYLKASGLSVRDHPVLEKLVYIKALFDKLSPIDKALKYPIEKLLSAKKEGGDDLRAHPGRLRAVDGDASGDEEDKDVENVGPKVYRAPKVVSMEYTRDNVSEATKALREAERQKARLRKTELVQSLRHDLSEAPIEIGGDEAGPQGRREAAAARRAKEREAYEEEYLTRKQLSLAERSEMRRLERKLKVPKAVGSTLDDLADFAELAADIGYADPTLGRPEGKKSALGAYLSAAKKAQTSLEISSNPRSADCNSATKATRRLARREPEPNEDDHVPSEAEEDPIVTLEQKKKRRAADAHRLPKLPDEVTGKRNPEYKILKNKGLTRKRKRTDGNARVANRMKFDKASKKINKKARFGAADGGYEGETTGLRTHLKKSMNLA